MENQEPFRTMIVSDDQASAFLMVCQLEQCEGFQLPVVFREVRQALTYLEEKNRMPLSYGCLNLPQVVFVDGLATKY
jgi:hypothetical protein